MSAEEFHRVVAGLVLRVVWEKDVMSGASSPCVGRPPSPAGGLGRRKPPAGSGPFDNIVFFLPK